MKSSIGCIVDDAKRRDALNRMRMPVIELPDKVVDALYMCATDCPLDFDKHCNLLVVNERGEVQGIITYRLQVISKSRLGTIYLKDVKSMEAKASKTKSVKEENEDDR